jgi:two-component system, cell cycle sensor histidine kinase and response regulator CckA
VTQRHPPNSVTHSLLQRQIRRHLGPEAIPENARGLLDAVDEAYRQSDRDRAMLERALEISSQELLQVNRQMRAMLRATPDVFMHIGSDGTVLDYNADPLIDVFCTHAPENDAPRRLVLERELFARFKAATNGLTGGQSAPCFDIKPADASGRVFEVRIVMLFLGQAVIYIRDVTEKREAEVQLRESEERYRNLFDSSPHPMWVYDVETLAFLAVNDAAVLHYGYSRDEFLSMTIVDIRPPAEVPKLMKALNQAPLTDPKLFGVFRHSRKDGSESDAEISSRGIMFRGIKAGLTLAMDVTEKRRLEIERETMQRQLEQAHRISSLGNLAATMAHEFNNVLMGIQPFVEVISRQAPGNTKVELAVSRIGTAIKRGKRVTSEILNLTRQTSVTRKPIALREWLAELGGEARGLLGTGIDLRIEASHGLVVSGDSSHLQQVFLNLITNARDAMAGSGELVLEVRRGVGSGVFAFGAVENVEAFAHFIVTDSGAGIPRHALPHIFEPLFTTKHSGTGLGLALTQRIVEQHDGRIFVDSEEGRGTAVHVFLPLSAAASASIDDEPAFVSHGIRKLALVEDDHDVTVGLATLLELEGIEVAIARTGAEAMDVIGGMGPDAVLLDVGLPDTSGLDVYAQIAERWPALPVIFATGHGDISNIQDLTTKPHVGFLLKPYELRDLLKVLESVRPDWMLVGNAMPAAPAAFTASA